MVILLSKKEVNHLLWLLIKGIEITKSESKYDTFCKLRAILEDTENTLSIDDIDNLNEYLSHYQATEYEKNIYAKLSKAINKYKGKN